MKKLLISLCAALAIAGCGKEDENTIKIGAVLPMTGPNAAFGIAMRAGMETAIEDKTNTKYKYKIIYEDGQQLAAKSVSAAQKLASADRVKVFVSTTTGVGHAIAPVADNANVLNLNATFDTESVEPMGKYSFFQGASIETRNEISIRALQKNKVKSMAIIAVNVGISCPGVTALAEQLNKTGIKTTVDCFNPGERDFKFVADKYKNVDAYYVSAFPPESEILLRQLYAMGVDRNRIYGSGFDFGQDTELFQGVNVIAETLGREGFFNRIHEKYNLKNQKFASVAYDLVSLAIDAFEAVGPDNMDAVYDYIRQHATRECMSGTCKLLPNGFIVNEAEWRTYKDGKPVVFEK
ncbi:MAG: ABC transporter substrate-binding protein [Alphaproteobacteria bacterium]|nr:ABC transporter substrate-binding protein [Alphaproteobacteria bacterium]